MSQPDKPPAVGDVLLLGMHRYDIVCRVIKAVLNRWEAQHLFCIGTGAYPHSTQAVWWGPDPKSWASVTNLGPCIPAEESEHERTAV